MSTVLPVIRFQGTAPSAQDASTSALLLARTLDSAAGTVALRLETIRFQLTRISVDAPLILQIYAEDDLHAVISTCLAMKVLQWYRVSLPSLLWRDPTLFVWPEGAESVPEAAAHWNPEISIGCMMLVRDNLFEVDDRKA